jgi:hypothetical protein
MKQSFTHYSALSLLKKSGSAYSVLLYCLFLNRLNRKFDRLRWDYEQATVNYFVNILFLFEMFFFFGVTNHCGCIFHSPVAGFSTSSFSRFLDHTRRATFGRTPLDEWSIRHRDLYLTTHNTHNRQTSMPQVRFEPTISAGERPKTYALDRHYLRQWRLNRCSLLCLSLQTS